jgi:hypothetical protein
MIRDEAEKISASLQERLAQASPAVTAAVKAEGKRVEFAVPGGARPTVVRYRILLTCAGQVARLELAEAEALVEEIGPEWSADRLFEEIRSRGVTVETAGPTEDN